MQPESFRRFLYSAAPRIAPPTWAVQSAGTVTYHRKTPEVAILNRYNGNDQSFYKKLIGNTDGNESDRAKYWQYNAVTLFAQRPSGDAAQYSTRATDDETWDSI